LIWFSFDSIILTAVGMTNGVEGALLYYDPAVVISVLIMMQFAVPVEFRQQTSFYSNSGFIFF
jgi:predicted tellurium resistance membrane protein TerC